MKNLLGATTSPTRALLVGLLLLLLGLPAAAQTTLVPSSTGDANWLWQNRLPQGNGLFSIQCLSPSNCLAVGSGGSLVRFDGTTWSAQRIPVLLPGEGVAVLSCPSATRCFASGSEANNAPLMLTYDGSTWTRMSNVPTTVSPMQMLSCPTTTSCVAANQFQQLLIYDGTSWSQPAPLPNKNQYTLSDLSCSSPTFCLAATRPHSGVTTRYYLTFNGTTWVENVMPSQFSQPDKVSCLSATECYAATWQTTVDFLRFNGTSWSLMPAFPRTDITPQALDCVASDRCVLVGNSTNYNLSHPRRENNAFLYNGTQWYNASPSHTGEEGIVKALSCADRSYCYAVTDDGGLISVAGSSGSYVNKTLGMQLLMDVACPSTTSCFAVGTGGTVLRYDGTRWLKELTWGTGKAELRGINCPSTTRCFVVGWDYSSNPNAVILSYDGTSWKAESHSLGGYSLIDISCPSTTRCFGLTSGYDQILQYNGVSWTLAQQPNHTASKLNALDCPSINTCHAVGAGGRTAYFNGSTWTYQDISAYPELMDIDCVSSECFASGDGGYNEDAVIYRYAGGVWSLSHSLPNASKPYHGVSCTSTSHCVAVGKDTRVFNGATWAQVNPGSYQKTLQAVSCPASNLCMGVTTSGGILEYQQ